MMEGLTGLVHRMQLVASTHRILKLALLAGCLAAIFVADTTTNYEVAVPMFYTAVILVGSRMLHPRALVVLAGICVGLTVLSMLMTPSGNLRTGIINMAISVAAVTVTTYLLIKMEATRAIAAKAQAQAQLIRMARIQSMEGLTTSIAHEVNQPLAAIVTSGNACQRWLAQQPPNIDKAHAALERILADAERASSTIARVRSLTRGDPPRKAPFAFNAAVQEIISLSQAELGQRHIALVVDLAPNLPPALADRVQVQQVIGNLMLNAMQAMDAVALHSRILQIRTQRDGAAILLSIADTGVGLSADGEGHLFDAFWTTKEDGVGVGLSISRTIVEANGGRIWAEPRSSVAGQSGAVFRFTVPAAAQEERL